MEFFICFYIFVSTLASGVRVSGSRGPWVTLNFSLSQSANLKSCVVSRLFFFFLRRLNINFPQNHNKQNFKLNLMEILF